MIGLDIRKIDRQRTTKVAKAAAALALVLAIAPRLDEPIVAAAPDGQVFQFRTAQDLDAHYKKSGYTLTGLVGGATAVPRLYLVQFSRGWAEKISPVAKKNLFYRTMLPLILRVNESVRANRRHLLDIDHRLAAGEQLAPADAAWLAGRARGYGVLSAAKATADEVLGLGPAARRKVLDRLRLRMDEVPVSLALAQAALESGYATSRFATEGNAFFGQWRKGGGMKPDRQRASKSDYGVANFATPLASVRAYLNNLNTHPAYKSFRNQRAEMRLAGPFLVGDRLAQTLYSYAETGPVYVDTLRTIIGSDQLGRLDGLRLQDSDLSRLVPVAQRG
jgi:Bax protein